MLRYNDNALYVRADGASSPVQVTLQFEQRFPYRVGLSLRNVVAPSFNPPSEHVIDAGTLTRAFSQKTRMEMTGYTAYEDIQMSTPDGDAIGFVKSPGGWLMQVAIADFPHGGTVRLNSYRLKAFLEKVEFAQLLG